MQHQAEYTYIDIDDPQGISQLLRQRGWLEAGDEILKVERAGEGNMNCTLRLHTGKGTSILKQSRPWVEKYPQIAAPQDRLLVEAAFYAAVADLPQVAGAMPQLLGVDRKNRMALFEDLGPAADYTSLYGGAQLQEKILIQLCQWLSALHNTTSFAAKVREELVNIEMRQLNHEHLFHFPLVAGNGLALDEITPGLQAEATRLQNNRAYIEQVAALGRAYLGSGTCLLHGDYYPGSWLDCSVGARIIDPEFCFFGPAEYDLGVFVGHLWLADQDQSLIRQVFATYQAPPNFEPALALQYAGMEIMRRLIGVAQLPLQADIERKRQLLRLSEQLVLEPDASHLS